MEQLANRALGDHRVDTALHRVAHHAVRIEGDEARYRASHGREEIYLRLVGNFVGFAAGTKQPRTNSRSASPMLAFAHRGE